MNLELTQLFFGLLKILFIIAGVLYVVFLSDYYSSDSFSHAKISANFFIR